MTNTPLVERILQMVEAVERDPPHISVYSTQERIAVALVLDRRDLLHIHWGTILESVERLGPDWFQAALLAQRMR